MEDPGKDDFDTLLSTLPPEEGEGIGVYGAPADVQERVYARTQGVLRARRQRHLLARWGVAGLAYAAGLLTAFFLPSLAEAPPTVSPPQVATRAPAPAAITPSPAAGPAPDAATMEQLAVLAPFAERTALLRQAGDAYFEGPEDMARALHCYQQYVLSLTFQELADAPQDNWLLASLKAARREELDPRQTSQAASDRKDLRG